MRIRGRIGSVVVGVVTVLVVGATAAWAQGTPSPTAPRTTVPTVSPQAGSFPVLQTADLPDGYRMGAASPSEIRNTSPNYPSVEKCVTYTQKFSGLTPVIYQSYFLRTATDTGLDIAHVFDATKPARAYFDNLEKAYRAAAKCKEVQAPSSSDPSRLVDVGKYSITDVGKLGDESFGVTIEPSSELVGINRYAFFRDGESVVLLRTIDDGISAKEFKALAKVAEKRAS